MSMLATGRSSGNTMTGSKDIIPKGFQKGQLGQFTPEQMQLFQQLFSSVGPGSFTSKLAGGDQGAFDQIEAPALRQFGALQGQQASRFSGMGSLGGRRSSGFQNLQNQASSDFAERLQSQRQGLQRQALQDLFGMSNQLLGQRPYDQFLTEEKKPWWQELLGSGAFGSLIKGGAAGGTLYGLNKMNQQQGGGQQQGGTAGGQGMDFATMAKLAAMFI